MKQPITLSKEQVQEELRLKEGEAAIIFKEGTCSLLARKDDDPEAFCSQPMMVALTLCKLLKEGNEELDALLQKTNKEMHAELELCNLTCTRNETEH